MDNKQIPGGLVVVFEGIDGTGKTSQLELVRDVLVGEGWSVHATRNLGGTPIGEELRKVMKSNLPRPESVNVYLSVAIQEALVESVNEQRAQGKIILLDRGPFSLAAYEVYGAGLDESLVMPYVKQGLQSLKPDLTIVYQADVATALARAKQKPQEPDYFESKPISYFERVSEGYRHLAGEHQATVLVDANQSIEAAHQQTMLAINGELGTRQLQ